MGGTSTEAQGTKYEINCSNVFGPTLVLVGRMLYIRNSDEKLARQMFPFHNLVNWTLFVSVSLGDVNCNTEHHALT